MLVTGLTSVAIFSSLSAGYLIFKNLLTNEEEINEEIEEREGTKDLYTVKALLVQEYNFEELVFMGGYEVTKRKGAL